MRKKLFQKQLMEFMSKIYRVVFYDYQLNVIFRTILMAVSTISSHFSYRSYSSYLSHSRDFFYFISFFLVLCRLVFGKSKTKDLKKSMINSKFCFILCHSTSTTSSKCVKDPQTVLKMKIVSMEAKTKLRHEKNQKLHLKKFTPPHEI